MKMFLVLVFCGYVFTCHAGDWNSPINLKYQSKNPEMYELYQTTFELLNKWGGQGEILREAFDNLSVIIKSDAEFAPAYRELGRLYIMAASNGQSYDPEMLENARMQIQKSIEIETNYADSYVLLGHLYTNLKQYELARENLNKAKEISTESPWLALNSAKLYKIHGQYEKEYQEYLSVVNNNTSNVKANLVATSGLKKHYERTGDYKNADYWFQKSLEFADHSAWTYGNHASDLLYKRGDFDGAIENAKIALSKMNYGLGRKTLSIALYSKWASELKKGNLEIAEDYFTQANEMEPDLMKVYFLTKKYKATSLTTEAIEQRIKGSK